MANLYYYPAQYAVDKTRVSGSKFIRIVANSGDFHVGIIHDTASNQYEFSIHNLSTNVVKNAKCFWHCNNGLVYWLGTPYLIDGTSDWAASVIWNDNANDWL